MGRGQGLENNTAPRVLRTERSRGNNSLQLQGCWDRVGEGPVGLQLGTGVLPHMEHLALGWVLLAGTLAGTSVTGSKQDLSAITEKVMDMAQNSFDDQYWGCRYKMEEKLKEVNRTEFQNKTYADTWGRAVEKWQSLWGNSNQPQVLRQEQAVAVLAYTAEGDLYKQFNAAVREGGCSREHDLQSFPFKTLHFLLTEALRTLQEAQDVQDCHTVYRGVRDIRFTAQLHQTVRFGQFASTSLKKEVAETFGQDTFFFVYTCYGVPIKDLSTFPGEEEVLIPPFEVFKVTNVTRDTNGTFIHLHSQAACSTYNCALLKEKRLGEEMEDDNRTEPWHRSLQAMLDALNQTLHGAILRPATPRNASARASRDDNAYMYILFVMTLFAATVGSLILGYTRSRKVDKRSDPYHVYIKNRVSMI